MRTSRNDDGPKRTQGPLAGELSFSSIASLCRRHRALLVTWIAVVMLITGLMVFNLTPAYQASAELVLDTRLQRSSDYASVMSGPFTLTDYAPIVRSEAQILKSPALASRVIDQLSLADSPEFRQATGLRARVGHFVANSFIGILPKAVAEAVVAHWGADPDPEAQRNLRIEDYVHRLSVVNDGRSLTISVMFWANDPRLAANIVNEHVRMYITDQRALKEVTAQHASDRIGQQLERLGADLRQKEDILRDFREKAGLVNVQGSTVLAQAIYQLNDQLSRARVELTQREALVAQVKRDIALGADVQSEVLNSNLIQRLRQQEAELGSTLARIRSRYSGDSSVASATSAQIADIRQQIARETSRIISSITAEAKVAGIRVAEFTAQLQLLKTQLAVQDRASVRAAEMERDLTAERGVYNGLMGRQQQIAAQVGAEPADARIVSLASVPRLPYYPKTVLFLMLGFVAASSSGVGVAYLVKFMRPGVYKLEEINGATDVPTLNAVPFVRRAQAHGRSLPDYLLDKPTSEFANCIRSLRADIIHSNPSSTALVLTITSALPGEGKTTVALSIARSMAAAGLHVLLIDCDLRRSRCASMIGVSPLKAGLIGMLGNDASSLENAVICDPRSSLKLLVAEEHPTIPQDLLDRPALPRILARARAQFDFVILDTPPIAAASEAWSVAKLADLIVLAVRWKSTDPDAVAEVIRAFKMRHMALTGLFLNGVDLAMSAPDNGQGAAYKAIRTYYANG